MADQNEQIPGGQRFYDNLLLLFILGLLIMLVSYTGWGLYEIISQPGLPK